MNEFLNPKSMVTPGVAGAMAMLIANSIVSQFPEAPFRWVMVLLSFTIGTIVFYAITIPVHQRFAFWAINSLIIFSVGVGTSNVAANVQKSVVNKAPDPVAFIDIFIPSAHAQSVAAPTPQASSATSAPLNCEAEKEALFAQVQQLKAQLAASSLAVKNAQRQRQDQVFFKRW